MSRSESGYVGITICDIDPEWEDVEIVRQKPNTIENFVGERDGESRYVVSGIVYYKRSQKFYCARLSVGSNTGCDGVKILQSHAYETLAAAEAA